jgi:hypothetical protein
VNPDYPDKYDYQNIGLETFGREYERRKTVEGKKTGSLSNTH